VVLHFRPPYFSSDTRIECVSADLQFFAQEGQGLGPLLAVDEGEFTDEKRLVRTSD